VNAKTALRDALPGWCWESLLRVKHRSLHPHLAAPRVLDVLARMGRQGFRPEVVLDVGAAHGYWTRSCRRLFPEADYVMVEPLPEYEAELRAIARDTRVTYLGAAAGRVDGRLPLLVPDDPTGSSLLPAAEPSSTFFKREVAVPVVALDGVTLPGPISLLKLDVQGYELEALRGAERILGEAEVLVCECSLHPFQRGIPLIGDVLAYLAERNFRILDVGDEVRWKSGVLAQLDLVLASGSSPLLDSSLWN
jgi:FkbM family methyltransferase